MPVISPAVCGTSSSRWRKRISADSLQRFGSARPRDMPSSITGAGRRHLSEQEKSVDESPHSQCARRTLAAGFASPLVCSLVYSGPALVYAVSFLPIFGGC